MSTPTFRFAPSPNGFLHLGHAYSVLLNEALAARLGGRLLLRIEDIDPTRSKPELVAAIHADLAWLGLRFDGAVLRQSERMDVYRAALDRLIGRSLAYPCFCSRGQIAAAVAAREAEGRAVERDPDGTPLYPRTCLALPAAEVAQRLAAGQPHTWRLDMAKALGAVPEPLGFTCLDLAESGANPLSPLGRGPNAPRRAFGERRRSRSEGEGDAADPSPHPRLPPCFADDEVGKTLSPPGRGGSPSESDVAADPGRWGDAVIARRDVPTSYHLAVVLDDAAQGVTHVVRGEDLRAATDLHVLLQKLLGLPSPAYHHHGLILAADGEKLAKSRGSESLADLRAQGVSAAEIRARLGFG